MKELLEDIFSLLNPLLLKEEVFQQLEEILMNQEYLYIKVNSEIADILDEDYYDYSYDISDTKVLEITGKDISFDVIEEDIDRYYVSFNKKGQKEETDIVIFKTNNLTRIESATKAIENSWYTTFNSGIYWKTSNGNIFSYKGEKDLVFYQEFRIPFPLARYFRLTFPSIAPVIRDYLEYDAFSNYEEYLTKKDYCLFLKPFYISELNDIIHNKFFDDTDPNIISSVYSKKEEAYDTNNINDIVTNLIDIIGNGKVIMSYNIYQSILMYLLGYYDTLNTYGYIIKNEDSKYTLYIINIVDKVISFIPIDIDKDKVISFYNNNPLNKESFNVSEFLDHNNTRKLK